MQSNPRISANLLVTLVNILVNLLVKLAKLRVRGAMGAPGSARREKKGPKNQNSRSPVYLEPGLGTGKGSLEERR